MTHWQMDDAFLGHHKTKRALRHGLESLLMWCALRTYVAVNLSDGVIPDEDIDDLPHAPKNPRRWLAVLVECGKPLEDGTRGPGLVDHLTGNRWALHDYQDHGESKEKVEARRAATRERQKRFRNAGGQRATNAPTNEVSNEVSNGVTNASPSHPIPSQKRSESSIQRPDRSEPESGTVPAAAAVFQHDSAKIPCPADLSLLGKQASSLELSPGIPVWAQRQIRDEFVAAELGDPSKTMPVESWRKCLSKAMCSRWSDPRRRPKPAEPDASEPGAAIEMHPVAKARLARYAADREAAIAKAAAEHDAKGLTPVRDLRALTEGIGG